MEQVVALNRELLGDDHPGVADSLSDLAELLRAQGKLDEVCCAVGVLSEGSGECFFVCVCYYFFIVAPSYDIL